ncbi:unnamed protein product [Rotaria sp. Silwood1]|nr:unnamed protein product [Rotaria sp. Silwood1]CAF0772012.1 unnamed protein product [Rotaria sp. Silwood1]CAF3347882.1 unnamed protein product [Rotaria sp. Silwood1]CAF4869566.1 unnamed protein product [Rotaria sp. Silwood1]
MAHRENRDRRTLYCGNLHENVTEEMLFELFLQSGPLETVTMKRDGRRSFAFITFKHEESVPYAEAIMESVCLFNRPLRLAARSSNKDFSNNPNEPYTPEIYVNDSLLHRSSSWQSPQSQQQQQQQQQQQPLPVPLFSNNDMSYSPQPHYANEDRMSTPRFDRRKQNSYHPYSRNEQDYQNMKSRNGNYNQQRRGGGGGAGSGYNNYYR